MRPRYPREDTGRRGESAEQSVYEKSLGQQFFGLPTDGAIELFLSKQHSIENSVFDLSLDRLKFLALPSTLSPPVASFLESDIVLASPMMKSHSDIFSEIRIKPTDSPRPAEQRLKRPESTERTLSLGCYKLLDIKLFTTCPKPIMNRFRT